MTIIVFSDTYKRVTIGNPAKTPQGVGEVVEVRDNCAFPVFARFADGSVNAFTQHEVSCFN